MKKMLLILSIVTIIAGCGQEKKNSKLILDEGTVIIKYREIESSDRILEYADMSIVDKFDISVYSNKTNFVHFIAFYTLNHNKLDKPFDDRISLKSYKLFDQGVFNLLKSNQEDTSCVKFGFDCLLRIDHGPNEILGNDSLYFGVTRYGTHTAPMIGKITQSNSFKGEYVYKDNEVIPYYKAGVDLGLNIHKVHNYVIMGLILNDDIRVDYEKLFNASSLKNLIYYSYDSEKENSLISTCLDSFYLK